MVGSHVIVVPQLQYKSGLKQMMEKMSEKLRQQGSSAYLIEVGGSSYTGMFGYLTAFQETMNQNLLEDFDDIVITVGSGGSASGIAIANYLTGTKLIEHYRDLQYHRNIGGPCVQHKGNQRNATRDEDQSWEI